MESSRMSALMRRREGDLLMVVMFVIWNVVRSESVKLPRTMVTQVMRRMQADRNIL